MDELKNKIKEILDEIGAECYQSNMSKEEYNKFVGSSVDQIISLFQDHFPDTTKMSQSYPNDYLKEYGRTVHKGGGR